MHALIDLFMIFAVWKWGNCKEWRKYHATMVFLAFANMLYNFLTDDYRLWVMEPDVLINFKIVEILYTVILLTGMVLIFLSRYPSGPVKKVIIYYVEWIILFVAVEGLWAVTGRIRYEHGWNLSYSAIFDCIMFPGIYLHYKRPILAYFVFTAVTIIGIVCFGVPVLTPWR